MGGNAATQTITVVVRGLALGELELKHAKKVLLKNIMVGFANGVLTGAVGAIAAYLMGVNYMKGLLPFLAMVVHPVIASFRGTVIPLGLELDKADPALSASVF